MSAIIINCAGDNDLAGKIKDYLMDKITTTPTTQSHDTSYLSLSEDEIELVPKKLGLSKENIHKLLQDFIKSEPDLSDHYSVSEFDEVFIVGIIKRLDDMVTSCEMCGYIASSEEDLSIHRRTHGLVFIL